MRADVASPPMSEWGTGAIQDFHQRMKSWVTDVLGEVSTSHDSPASMEAKSRCINLFLMALGPSLSTRNAKTSPLQLEARFMVTAWGPDIAQANDDLCGLGFAAMESPLFEVDFAPLPVTTWVAFTMPPRPAFSIHLPVRKQRAQRPARIVSAPLVVLPTLMHRLAGVVVGPMNVPIAGARVELLTLGLATQTDSEGQFDFAGVPIDRTLQFRVLARGLEQQFSPEISRDPEQRLQLRMDL